MSIAIHRTNVSMAIDMGDKQITVNCIAAGVLVDLIIVELLSSWDVLPADLVVHIRIDSTWSDAVDCDLLVTHVNCHTSDKCLNGTLASRVKSVLWDALCLTSNASHHDQPTTNRQVLVSLPRNEELTSGVDVHYAVILLLSNILNVTKGNNTGVRADDVELAEVSNGLCKQGDDVLDYGDVCLNGDSFAA